MTNTKFESILRSTPKLESMQIDPRMMTVAQAMKAGPPNFVDAKKTYTALLQLGECRRWRDFAGGRWVRDDAKSPPVRDGEKPRHALRHVARVHEIGPYSGAIINGLISEMNGYLANVAKPTREFLGETGMETAANPLADIRKQLLIFNIAESNELPVDDEATIKKYREAQLLSALERIATALEQGA